MLVIDVEKEIQEADSLCWAAVSTMAVRAFRDADFTPPTQREIVIYHEADIRTLAQLREAEKPGNPVNFKLEGFKQNCKESGSCNLTSLELHLFDLKSTRIGDDELALSPGHFDIEIGQRKRPVPIRWRYLGEVSVNGQARKGDHALIVTGYNPDTHELRIFDPWPAPDPDDGIQDLTPEQHEKWIPYEVYLEPRNDHGLDVIANHAFDEYQLQRVGDNTDLEAQFNYPELAPVQPRVARREKPVDFGKQGIPDDLFAAIEKEMNKRVVRDSSGAAVHGPLSAGRPIPVIALQMSRIIAAARNPASLFKSETSVVAVPVLRNGQMVDSFLMLNDENGWHAGGYCNNRIASLLLQAREIHGEKPEESRFYLVSIPELSTFFVAHGYFDQATIAGLSRSRLRNLKGCRGMLEDLVHKVQREGLDLARIREAVTSALPPGLTSKLASSLLSALR